MTDNNEKGNKEEEVEIVDFREAKLPLLTEEDVREVNKRWKDVPHDKPVSVEDMRRIVAR